MTTQDDLGAVEALDYVSGHVRKTDNRVDDIASIKASGLGDRYLRGDFKIALVSPFGDETKFGFTIQVNELRRAGVGDGVTQEFGGPSSECGERVGPSFALEQFPMFANDVEVVKLPKKPVASLVRFEEFDFLSMRWGEPIYEFCPFVIPRKESSLALGDREVNIVPIRHAASVSQRSSQNVERASYGVDIGSRFDRERERRRSFVERHEHVMRGIRINLFDVQGHIEVDPSLHLLLEGWEFGYGPIY